MKLRLRFRVKVRPRHSLLRLGLGLGPGFGVRAVRLRSGIRSGLGFRSELGIVNRRPKCGTIVWLRLGPESGRD